MEVEVRREGYTSDLWKLAESAMDDLMFLDADGVQKPFMWSSRQIIGYVMEGGISGTAWAAKVSKIETEMKDEVLYFRLKADLIQHVWDASGNK